MGKISFKKYGDLVNRFTMTGKFGEHLSTTYGNSGRLFRAYQYILWSPPTDIEPETTEPKLYNLATVHITRKWRQIN